MTNNSLEELKEEFNTNIEDFLFEMKDYTFALDL